MICSLLAVIGLLEYAFSGGSLSKGLEMYGRSLVVLHKQSDIFFAISNQHLVRIVAISGSEFSEAVVIVLPATTSIYPSAAVNVSAND